MWIWIGTFSEYHPLMQTAGFTALAVTFVSLLIEAVTPGSRVGAGIPFSVSSGSSASTATRCTCFTRHSRTRSCRTCRQQWVIPGEMGAQLTRLVVSMAATIALAWLSWHVWEKHFLALKGHFSGVKSPAFA